MAGGLMLTVNLYAQTQLYLSLTSVLVTSWTYTYSSETMTWVEAKAWCENQSDGLMVIQNEQHNNYLKENLPHLKTYYWIGLRKTAGVWTWQGTAKVLEGGGSWADSEPNNKKQDEDCVEIYIKNGTGNGKWNDEKCNRQKHALCYNVSCSETSCSNNAECVEAINNYTCKCTPGFTGPICLEVVQCPPIATVLSDLRMKCSHPLGTNSYNSSCEFSCDERFELRGSHTTQCDHTGQWTHNTPNCTGTLCKALSVPEGGNVSCYRGNSTICTVQCPSAYLLLGAHEYICRSDGSWNQFHPVCASYKHMLMASSGCAAFSTICCCMFCCSYCRKRKKSVEQNDQEKVMNPVYDAGDELLEDPLSSV